MTTPQELLVFKNDIHKFAHVGIYNMFRPDETTRNYNTFGKVYSKAAYAARNAHVEATDHGTSTTFLSAFYVRMMNTPKEDWHEETRAGNLDLKDAFDLKTDIINELEQAGYTVSGKHNNKGIRCVGGSKIPNTQIKNATLEKIYRIVDELTEGMVDIDLHKTKKTVYLMYIRGIVDTKREIWSFINENIDMFSVE